MPDGCQPQHVARVIMVLADGPAAAAAIAASARWAHYDPLDAGRLVQASLSALLAAGAATGPDPDGRYTLAPALVARVRNTRRRHGGAPSRSMTTQ